MLTPNEVMNQRFDKQKFGGYSLDQIDAFLKRLTEDYATLYKDNTLLKSKMKSLVTTIEDYKRVEEGMRKTLLNSQKMADSLIQEARVEAKRIVEQAGATVAGTTGDLEERVHREEARLQQVKQQTVAFSNVIRELFARQLQMLEAVPSHVDSETPIPHEDTERHLSEAAREIEQNLNAQLDSAKDTMSFAFVQGGGEPVAQDTELLPNLPTSFPSETVFTPTAFEPPQQPQPAQPEPPFVTAFAPPAASTASMDDLFQFEPAPQEPAFPQTTTLPQQDNTLPFEPVLPETVTAPDVFAQQDPFAPQAAVPSQTPAAQEPLRFEQDMPTTPQATTAPQTAAFELPSFAPPVATAPQEPLFPPASHPQTQTPTFDMQPPTPQPTETEPSPAANISTTALQDTLTRLRQMDNSGFPNANAQTKDAEEVLQRLLHGGNEAMAKGVEDTTATLPKIDFNALNFGSNYKPGDNS
ncbi:MAG: DivIVA domain-containing protein [Oscillospiraceae bacterium]|nr:DivIVA domain-containing protein [Oscillospiraceae bacterium]